MMQQSSKPSWTIHRRLLMGPVLMVLLWALNLGILLSLNQQNQQTSNVVMETISVLKDSAELLKLVVDMETGVRGFSLTRNEAFLEPYFAARAHMEQQLSSLRFAIQDDEVRLEQITLIEAAIADWQEKVARPQIALVYEDGDVEAFVRSGVGKIRLDRIRVLVAEFEAATEAALEIQRAFESEIRFWLNISYGLFAVAAISAFWLTFQVVRGIINRLRTLGQATQEVAAGNLQLSLDPGQADEISTMVMAFNKMITSLAAAQAQVVAKNKELVLQVQAAEIERSKTVALLNAVDEAILLITPEQQVAVVNYRFEDLFGIDTSQMLHQPLSTVWPLQKRILADADELYEKLLHSLQNTEESFEQVVEQRWPQPRELALYTTPVTDSDGHFLGRLLVFRDITHQRSVERMKNEFLLTVSHELRTPLTSIKGYVDLLLSGAMDPPTEQQRDFLGIIKTSADRLMVLVNDLLDISRLEAGHADLRRTAVDFRSLLQATISSLQPQLQAKSQTLSVQMPETVPLVFGDPNRLAQVLLNLLSNAHKYSPANTSITVRVDEITDALCVEVIDNGIGLSESERQQVFTKFFRASNRATREAGGTGLGLSIAYSLVKMHGGELTVESEPDKGSTFRFTVPLLRPETKEAVSL